MLELNKPAKGKTTVKPVSFLGQVVLNTVFDALVSACILHINVIKVIQRTIAIKQARRVCYFKTTNRKCM